MENSRMIKMKLGILFALLTSAPFSFGLEVGTNCIAITCETTEGFCCQRSDLELKLTLVDNCSKFL